MKTLKKINLLFILISIIVILIFQNCGIKGYNSLNEKFNFFSSYGGNGGGYDGKLIVTLTYKDQKIYTNNLTMYSGEKMIIEVSGGTSPYSFVVNGRGFLEVSTQSYIAPFYDSSPIYESIEVTDTIGNSATITIKINSFTGKNKLQYPLPGNTDTLNFPSQIQRNSKGDLFTVIHSKDFQGKINSILRNSNDEGETWSSLKRISNENLNLYINNYDNYLYLISDDLKSIYISKDEGKNWEKSEVIFNFTDSNNYLTIKGLNFLPDNSIFAFGTVSSFTSMDSNWCILKSIDHGKTWFIVDQIKDSNISSGADQRGVVNTLITAQNGDLYAGGTTGYLGSSRGTLLIRKSTDNGQSWISDFKYEASNLEPLSYSLFMNMLIDSKQNIFFSAEVTYESSTKSYWNIFKKDSSSSNWSLIKSYNYLDQAQAPVLSILKSDHILIMGQGKDLNEATGEITNHNLILKSEDNGATWSTLYDLPRINLPNINQFMINQHIIESRGGSLLFSGYNTNTKENQSKTNIYKSMDQGTSWKVTDEFQDISFFGGDFKVNDFLQLNDEQLFLIGEVNHPNTYNPKRWIVFKSRDKGENWEAVDRVENFTDFQSTDSIGSSALSIVKNNEGAVFVSGQYIDRFGTSHWLIRKTSDGGISWFTVKNYSGGQNGLYDKAHFISYLQNNLFTIGTVSKSEPSTLNANQKNIFYETSIITSDDQGLQWSEAITFDKWTIPISVSNCRNDSQVAILLKYPDNSYSIKISHLDPSQWFTIDLPINFDFQNKTILSDLFCENETNLSFFAYENKINVPGLETKLYFYHTQDQGNTWSTSNIKFSDENLNYFIPSSITLKDSFFWIGGHINLFNKELNQLIQNWTTVRLNMDFQTSFIADKIDSHGSSNVKKVRPCLSGICLIGSNSDSNTKEIFSVFRYIEAKKSEN